LARRVRGKKYFSACKRENRSLLADDLCAAAGRNPFVKKGLPFLTVSARRRILRRALTLFV